MITGPPGGITVSRTLYLQRLERWFAPADGDGAAADLLAVHPLDGVLHRLFVAEQHEPEATGPPRLTVVHDLPKSQQSADFSRKYIIISK